MTIEAYPEELAWVEGKTVDAPGDFLRSFLEACVRADWQNYELMRPLVHKMMVKYPVRSSTQEWLAHYWDEGKR